MDHEYSTPLTKELEARISAEITAALDEAAVARLDLKSYARHVVASTHPMLKDKIEHREWANDFVIPDPAYPNGRSVLSYNADGVVWTHPLSNL